MVEAREAITVIGRRRWHQIGYDGTELVGRSLLPWPCVPPGDEIQPALAAHKHTAGREIDLYGEVASAQFSWHFPGYAEMAKPHAT